jgi:hypothetical protein
MSLLRVPQPATHKLQKSRGEGITLSGVLSGGAVYHGKGQNCILLWKIVPGDQCTFDRWLTANAIFSLIFAIGIIAMALAGSKSVGPGDAAVATVAASEARRKSRATEQFK